MRESVKDFLSSQNFKRFFPLFILGVALPLVIFAALQVQDIRQRASPLPSDTSLTGLSNAILQNSAGVDVTGKVSTQTTAEREYKAVSSAKTRKELMLKKAEENPEEFLLNAFPARVRDGLSPEVQKYIEKESEQEGELQVLHFDNFKEKKQKTEYRLLIKDGKKIKATYKLNFAKKVPNILTGSKVRAKGYQLDDHMVIQGGEGGGFEIIDPQEPSAIGDQKTLVLLFNFKDDNTEPVSKQEVDNYIFGDANSAEAYFKETSYGKTSFSGDIVGYFKIPYSNIDCNQNYEWSISADSVAFANGYDTASYSRIVYVFPTRGNCWASAWATIGGTPSKAWMTDASRTPGIYAHELGHNLGVSHANSYECRDKQVGDFASYDNSCFSNEYGEPSDVMGFSAWTNMYGFNAPHRDEVKWLDPGQILNVSSDGEYKVNPLNATTSANIKALKIAIPNSSLYYYLSYRKPLGFDSSLDSGITEGAAIQTFEEAPYVNSSYQTNLIDNYPEGQYYNDFSNSSLKDGGEFNDPYNGIKIREISHNDDYVSVDISLDKSVCRRGVPDFFINPTTQVGALGEAVSYQVSLKNNDTPNCSSSTFRFGDDKYDWNVTYSEGSVTLAPGQSKELTKTVTPPFNSRIGIYTLNTSLYSDEVRHRINVKNSFIVTGGLGYVWVNPGKVEIPVGKEIGMSALAYDMNGNAIRSGVTYEWSMSSVNSVGTLGKTEGVINTLLGVKPGFGELTVIAKFNGGQVLRTVPINVTGEIPPPTTTLRLTPTDDSYARSNQPTKNFGNSNVMWVDGSPKALAFIKFDLSSFSGKEVLNAKIRLKVANIRNAQSKGNFRVSSVKEEWSERTVNYKNMPTIVSKISSFGSVKKNQTVEIDVTSWVKQNLGKKATLSIEDLSADDASFRSKNATSASNRPTLIIEYK
ncbi:MAG: Peptidase M11 gametolysin [Candidatus Levybacteria bacterium GW2011_GWA2_40_8]|nr:MAG: Peptidase M11 gametolysin [Candidatus Levybacteria bacterium GW2011_GWA2_40_8]